MGKIRVPFSGVLIVRKQLFIKLIASNKKAAEVLGWKPTRGLEQIIADAWTWHSTHPGGYEG